MESIFRNKLNVLIIRTTPSVRPTLNLENLCFKNQVEENTINLSLIFFLQNSTFHSVLSRLEIRSDNNNHFSIGFWLILRIYLFPCTIVEGWCMCLCMYVQNDFVNRLDKGFFNKIQNIIFFFMNHLIWICTASSY